MYIYEGEDYSKLTSENDKRSFDQLLAGECLITVEPLNDEHLRPAIMLMLLIVMVYISF